MTKQLILALCNTFQKEAEIIAQTQQWHEVEFHYLPEICRYPHLKPEAESVLAHYQSNPENEVTVIGCYGNCARGLSPEHPTCFHQLDLCLDMIHPPKLTQHLIHQGAYLVTPGWLHRWQDHFKRWGLDQATAREMYQESSQKIVLMDTLAYNDSEVQLQALGTYLDLPVESMPIGVEYMALYLGQFITNWQNHQNVTDLKRLRNEANRTSADYAMAMDLLTNLAQIRDEEHAILEVLDLFTMLFSAETVLYFPVANGQLKKRADHSVDAEIFSHIEHWLKHSTEILEDNGTGAGFYLRLVHHDETIAILSIGHLRLSEYQVRYMNLSASIANLCGLAISNARMYRQLHKTQLAAVKAREISDTLREALSNLVSMRDLEEVLKKSLESLHSLVNFSKAVIYLLENGAYQYRTGAAHHSAQQLLPFTPPTQLRSFPLSAVSGTEDDSGILKTLLPFFETVPAKKDQVKLLPLVAHDARIGFLMIGLKNEVNDSHSQENLLQAFANEISIAVENARLFEEIEQMATHDGLTGIFNRRHFYELATVEFKRSKRYNSPLSALMLDVDFFKRVNDTYGHPVGDRVLVQVAALCQENLREADLLGRFGGEEFVFLLPETDPGEALMVAERIRVLIAQSAVTLSSGEEVRVTVSLGIAGLDPIYANIEELLSHSDESLYRAKQNGRNRTVIYDPAWQTSL